jgi:hypothetical protein
VLLRVLLPIEVVKEAGKTPSVLITTAEPGIVPNSSLNRIHVLAQALVFNPLLK